MANAWKKMGSLRGPAGAGADVATSKKAGVVKPSGDFDITADGTLSLYTPMSVMSFTGGSDHEIGETVDTVNLAWKLNKTPATLTLDGQEIVKGEDGQFPTSQPLTKQALKANKTYTLAVTDARGSKASKTTSVLFHYSATGVWAETRQIASTARSCSHWPARSWVIRRRRRSP